MIWHQDINNFIGSKCGGNHLLRLRGLLGLAVILLAGLLGAVGLLGLDGLIYYIWNIQVHLVVLLREEIPDNDTAIHRCTNHLRITVINQYTRNSRLMHIKHTQHFPIMVPPHNNIPIFIASIYSTIVVEHISYIDILILLV